MVNKGDGIEIKDGTNLREILQETMGVVTSK